MIAMFASVSRHCGGEIMFPISDGTDRSIGLEKEETWYTGVSNCLQRKGNLLHYRGPCFKTAPYTVRSYIMTAIQHMCVIPSAVDLALVNSTDK